MFGSLSVFACFFLLCFAFVSFLLPFFSQCFTPFFLFFSLSFGTVRRSFLSLSLFLSLCCVVLIVALKVMQARRFSRHSEAKQRSKQRKVCPLFWFSIFFFRVASFSVFLCFRFSALLFGFVFLLVTFCISFSFLFVFSLLLFSLSFVSQKVEQMKPPQHKKQNCYGMYNVCFFSL